MKKFLVRDPLKRGSLEIVLDDAWINESYNESPISTDLSEQVEEDEGIIKIMESKYNLERSAILQALRDNVYNDVSAIYFLIYYDTEAKKNLQNDPNGTDVTKINNPVPKKESMTASEKEKAMPKIGEDEVLEESKGSTLPKVAANSPAVSPPSSGRRKRAATVNAAGSSEAQDKSNNGTAASPPTTEEEAKKPLTALNPIAFFRPGFQREFSSPAGPEIKHEEITQASPSRENIKRHNTITGMIRGLRRGDTGESTDSDKKEDLGLTDQPRSLRFTFNSNTTSSKPPDEIVVELVKVANKLNLTTKLVTRYLLECTSNASAASGKEVLKVEVEVCKLPRLNNLHGLRFKRVSGNSTDYKEICEQILASIQL